MNLSGMRACVTGGARGLGRTHALAMAEQGADLVLIDLNEEGLDAIRQEIEMRGRQCLVFAGSVDDAAFVGKAIDTAVDRWGGIDILVNNAGISGQYLSIEEIDDTLLTRMFQVHVIGAFNCTRAVLPTMKRQRAGRIINTASTWGLVGHEISSHYCAVKAALIGATKAWAKELAEYGICVNAIAPGWIDTNKWTPEKRALEAAKVPLGRFGTPEEVATLVAYLASPAAAFISGQVLSPNGGQAIT